MYGDHLGISFGEVVQRSLEDLFWWRSLKYRDLAKRPLLESLFRDLARRPFLEILHRDLEWKSLAQILPRGLLQRPG